jgi:hypothetical protein
LVILGFLGVTALGLYCPCKYATHHLSTLSHASRKPGVKRLFYFGCTIYTNGADKGVVLFLGRERDDPLGEK